MFIGLKWQHRLVHFKSIPFASIRSHSSNKCRVQTDVETRHSHPYLAHTFILAHNKRHKSIRSIDVTVLLVFATEDDDNDQYKTDDFSACPCVCARQRELSAQNTSNYSVFCVEMKHKLRRVERNQQYFSFIIGHIIYSGLKVCVLRYICRSTENSTTVSTSFPIRLKYNILSVAASHSMRCQLWLNCYFSISLW